MRGQRHVPTVLLWTASVHTRYSLGRYMPTNIALDAIRTPRLKVGRPGHAARCASSARRERVHQPDR